VSAGRGCGAADDLHVRRAHEDAVLGLGQEVGHVFHRPIVLPGRGVCGKRGVVERAREMILSRCESGLAPRSERTELDADKVSGRPVAGADVADGTDMAIAQPDPLSDVEGLDGCAQGEGERGGERKQTG
jgi:hypothetical protein